MLATNEFNRRRFFKTASAAASLIAIPEAISAQNKPGTGTTGDRRPKRNEAAAKVLAELEAKGGKFLNVPRKDGEFLSLLVKASRSKHVLEIGTSHGYSAIWIGLGLEETGGKLMTIEILAERVELAKKNLDLAELSQHVTVKEGDAHKLVPTLEGPFDFVFLDADKDGSLDYFKKLHPAKLSAGALIAVHNAISRKDAMQPYLDMISQHPDFDTTILSLTMDDGFVLSYRRRSG